MLLAVAVLSAQQCAEAEAEAAEPPENVLSYGLTHLWTSPILRYQLIAQGHPSLALLEAAVLSPGFSPARLVLPSRTPACTRAYRLSGACSLA